MTTAQKVDYGFDRIHLQRGPVPAGVPLAGPGASSGPAVSGPAGSHAPLLAGSQLPDRRPDLPPGQPAPARAAAAGARQAPPAWPLGHLARAEPHLRPPESADPRARSRRHLPGRSRPRRPRPGGQRVSRRHVLGGLPGDHRRTRTGCAACSASSPRRAASRATSACRRLARSTRAASSATCWSTPLARRSTIRT